MANKVHGFIAVDQNGNPIVGHYGDVLLWKRIEDARQHGLPRKVITGKGSTKKQRAAESEAFGNITADDVRKAMT